MRCHCIVIGASVVMLTSVAPVLAEDPLWAISGFINYSRGDYGTSKDTTLLYIPFTLRVTPLERVTVSLTVPYLEQTTQTVFLTGGGVAVRKEKVRELQTARERVTRTERGLGDVLLKGQYVLLEERPTFPEIGSYLKIKFPTADEERGLGTGEFDETLGLDLSKTFLERLVAYLTLAYTFTGSPPGTELHNSFTWSVGAAYVVTKPFSVFAFLDGATAIAAGQEDPLELRVGAEYRLTEALKLTGSAGAGLSRGSPDYDVAGGFAVRF